MDLHISTKLDAMTLKFETNIMDPKHTMAGHLRIVSAMIRDLKSAGCYLGTNQQILSTIGSLPNFIEPLKLTMVIMKTSKCLMISFVISR